MNWKHEPQHLIRRFVKITTMYVCTMVTPEIYGLIYSTIVHEKSKIPFSYMLYAYSVKRAYRGTKPKESFR